MPQLSLMDHLAALPIAQRDAILAAMSDEEVAALEYDWTAWARPNQLLPPGDWHTWLILAGRGFGKTRAGAETVIQWAQAAPIRIALVGETAADVREVMVEGESGILACSPPWCAPLYQPTKRRLTWPNGSIASTYSGDAPDQLRGPQHHRAWADESAKWRYSEEAWSNLELGLRLGDHPQIVTTTTPRPIALIRRLLKDPSTHVTRGSTYDNAAHLPPDFLARIRDRYEGTRLGRQELYAEVLDDLEGALWQRALFQYRPVLPTDLQRVVVAIDPATTSDEGANETGIIVAGRGVDGFFYILADASCRLSPDGWARRAINAYHEFHADRIIAEVNNGGDLVERVLRTVDPGIAYRAVHASRGKVTRAEPIAALYEQHKVWHVQPFLELEDQLCNYAPGTFEGSPDRLDALVWALTELDVPAVELW